MLNKELKEIIDNAESQFSFRLTSTHIKLLKAYLMLAYDQGRVDGAEIVNNAIKKESK